MLWWQTHCCTSIGVATTTEIAIFLDGIPFVLNRKEKGVDSKRSGQSCCWCDPAAVSVFVLCGVRGGTDGISHLRKPDRPVRHRDIRDRTERTDDAVSVEPYVSTRRSGRFQRILPE